MATKHPGSVLQYIRGLAGRLQTEDMSDGHLLQQFVASRDETAFASLVERHGPRVLGVCRHLLSNAHDVDDAFQATFLVLATKARSISKREAVGSWLYGVAHRVALRAQARAAQRRGRERALDDYADEGQEEPSSAVSRRESCLVMSEELSRLPEKYRAPLVLCDGEGRSWSAAARELRWGNATLQRRLERGRNLLRVRLGRRGVTLPAAGLAALLCEQTAAAVPLCLAETTVSTAGLVAAGQPATTGLSAAALADGVLQAMTFGKLKLAAALIVMIIAAAGAGLGAWATQNDGQAGSQTAHEQRQPSKNTKDARGQSGETSNNSRQNADQGNTIVLTARVLDVAQQPVPHADVAVIGLGLKGNRIGSPDMLSQGKANREGQYHFSLPGDASDRFWVVFLLARGPGHGLTRSEVPLDGKQTEVVLKLSADRAIRGHLVDLQGAPAKDINVRVVAFPYRSVGKGFVRELFDMSKQLAMWPSPTKTDVEGRFVLNGIGAAESIRIEIADDRFARQAFDIKSQKDKEGEVTLALAPARIVEGQVTYSDTGKPVTGARLWAETRIDRGMPYQGQTYQEGSADADGHFRFVLHPGLHCGIAAFPPEDQPYLPIRKDWKWPATSPLKQKIDLRLVRGVAVRGTIVETPSGTPVAGARVEFQPFYDNNPFYHDELRVDGKFSERASGPDGRFRLTVFPGPGHLLIKTASNDYLHVETTVKKLYGASVGPNRREYYEGFLPLNLKPDAGAHGVTIKVRRGVTLTGRLVGPDNRPIDEAVMVCRSYIEQGYVDWNPSHHKRIRGGRFELPGCDPEGTSEIFVLDARNRLGTVVTVSNKQSGTPLTVRLKPCGSALTRLVDGKGKPVAKFDTWVTILLTPGIDIADERVFEEKGNHLVLAETAWMDSSDRSPTDTQGRVTFPCLIPGATYWVGGQGWPQRGSRHLLKEFRVEAGQTLDLGDIRVKAAKPGASE